MKYLAFPFLWLARGFEFGFITSIRTAEWLAR